MHATRPRIHYHSDNSRFGGSETMLVNLLSSAELKRAFDISFSYRRTALYEKGLRQRVAVDLPLYPLDFRESSELFVRGGRSRAPVHRIGRLVSRQLFTAPLLAHEIAVMRRLFRRVRPDIVHINNGGYPGALSARAAAIAARAAGVPRVFMVLNNFARGYDGPGRWLELPLDRAVVASTDYFLAGSRVSAERIEQVLRLEPGRASAVANGADLRQSTETTAATRARLGLANYDGVIFAIVALMEPRKGHRVLLEALHEVVTSEGLDPSQLRLLLLGDGLLRSELESLVAARGLSLYCHFLGEEENGMNVIRAADVLVLSSVANEDFPNVVLEAMGAGKPVIASRIAGTPEQVCDGETGVLVPPGDSRALARALSTLRREPAQRASMGAAGRRRYQQMFTSRAAVERFTARYRSALIGVPSVRPDALSQRVPNA